MFTRGGIFIRNYRLRTFAPVDSDLGGGNDGGDGDKGGNGSGEPKLNEHGYPDDTPWREMKPEHQAAYWRHQSKKHEKNRKPDNFDDLLTKATKFDQLEDENKTPDQKAIDAARNAGIDAGRKSFLPAAIRGEIRALRPNLTVEEVDEFLEDLNLDKFLDDDGQLNTEKVTKLANKLDGGTPADDQTPTPKQTLADALASNGNPGASGGGGGSIAAMRKQRREQLTKKS